MKIEKLRGSLLVGASILLLSGAALAQQQEQQQMQEPAVGEAVDEGAPADLSSSDITELQIMLNEAGYEAGPVDGIWGPQTSTAVASFQRDHGLDPTGTIDAETRSALGVGGATGGEQMPEATGGAGMPGEQPEVEAEQPGQPQQ